jgi:rieske iron-sulfur protein
MPVDDSPHARCFGRRTVLGLALTPLLGQVAHAADDEAAAKPPAPDDHFVFLTGPKKGQTVLIEDLAVGGPQMQVYPVAPDGTVRNASRLNIVLLTRLDPATLKDDTKARAAEGVVAYSGVCTHQGCPVNMWSKERNAMVCSCHGSIFDPKNGAEVVFGPAPRPLPALGLKAKDGAVVVASVFSDTVGFLPAR